MKQCALQVRRRKTSLFGYFGKHPRTDFNVIVESEYEVRPTRTLKDSVGA